MDNLDPEFEKRFLEAHHSRASRLLKLAVLRDLVYELHRKKSRYLASQDAQSRAEPLERALRALEHAPGAALTEESIETILSNPLARREEKELPRQFSKLLRDQRFSRVDRKWERAILIEALNRGWTVGVQTNRLRHDDVQAYHENISRTLWPDGVTLFVESAEPQTQGTWHGRWWLVVKKADPGIPGFRPLFSPSL